MTQRRLDGVQQEPFTAKTVPACDDCGVTEAAHEDDSRRYPDGKMLRKYSDGGYGCDPCSNGTSEPTPWDSSKASPIADIREAVRQIRDLGSPHGLTGAADRIFPVIKTPEQTPFVAPNVPYVIYDKPCKTTLTGRIKCDDKPNLQQMILGSDEGNARRARAILETMKKRLPVGWRKIEEEDDDDDC